MLLDPEICYRAIATKDARFDGQFFVAVRTTRIYCRPICPANTPKPENCSFFVSAAAAQFAGYRPCLRCRPELAPHLFAQVGTVATVTRALRSIAAGALDEGSVTELATRLGVGDRHLRQLFAQHLGASPVAVAQTRRCLFAKQLIDETALSMTDIALAAGFTSLRRFNDAMSKTYGRSPSTLRRSQRPAATLSLKLPFTAPYNWAAIVRFLTPRVTPGLESVSLDRYQRTIALDGDYGWVEVRPILHCNPCGIGGQNYLVANICFPKVSLLGQIVDRLRRMFDLNANVAEISADLERDPLLKPLVAQQPGLRIPGAWDNFELAVRAILGQQVSVAAATTLAGRLVETYGEPLVASSAVDALRFVFPAPEVLAAADLTTLGMPRSRAVAIVTLATAVLQNPRLLSLDQSLTTAVANLCQLPGMGEWTAHYIAMRALREPDAFPASDLGLLRSMAALGHPVTKAQLEERSQLWRPWRSYAAMYLWSADSSHSVSPSKEAISA